MWAHHRCSDVPRQVSPLSCQDVFDCRTCLGHCCSIEEELEFKRGEDVLEEVEKFCYLGVIISYGGAFEAVSAKIGSAWKKFRELSGVLIRKQGRFISVVLDQFCCTVVKHDNLRLRMRQGCMGWSIV